ncbi:MAG: magnesium/cobalt transporter CorA [Bacteroidales bacterium]|nr:magnesium/cobalt transporter CorA [Bacteroidales bacterium]MCF8389068.1 magnesium/cobalt transporter CorA [Bacteroidales bacterium]
MARFLKDRSSTKDKAPGSMILIGRQKLEKPIIRLMHYNAKEIMELECKTINEAFSYIKKDYVSWINIYGIHDMALMEELRDLFGLHPLLMDVILNTDSMPKYENHENHEALILKMLSFNENETKVHAEQLSIILGENYVLTLQEKIGDVFNPVRERIRNNKGKLRLLQNDYLVYVLTDTLADNYLLMTETMGRKIEDCEEMIFKATDDKIAETIYRHKTELSYLRKNIRPLREMMIYLLKSEDSFFSTTTIHFLHDLNTLITQTNESIELYSSMVSDQLNTYNSIMGNKMNQVMKVLTIFASIFIPLTFFAGIYGMNFENIPELKYKYGYFIFWGIMLSMGLGLLYYFKRKKWL